MKTKDVRLHNGAKKGRKGRGRGRSTRRRNPANAATMTEIVVPLAVGGFLSTFSVQAEEWVRAKSGWDPKMMAIAKLGAAGVGAWGLIWALDNNTWAKKNRTAVLVGGTAFLAPLVVGALATLIPETVTAPAVGADGTTGALYRASAAPMLSPAYSAMDVSPGAYAAMPSSFSGRPRQLM